MTLRSELIEIENLKPVNLDLFHGAIFLKMPFLEPGGQQLVRPASPVRVCGLSENNDDFCGAYYDT